MAVVLSDEESHAVFGVKLAKKKIQPVWLRIENGDDKPHWVLPISVDPDCFAPLEAAHKARLTFQSSANEAMREDFAARGIRLRVDPGRVNEGFVFNDLDKGAKAVNVDLLSRDGIGRLVFVFRIPGLKVDFEEVDFVGIYGAEAAGPDAPRENYTGDEYFTDGLRLVTFLRTEETAVSEIRFLDWGSRPDR